MTELLSSLPKLVERRKKRIGRGSGSGKGNKSGRGTTRHQKARESIPLYFEGGQGRVVKKYPLLRGKGKNKSIKIKPLIINLKDLNVFKDGDTVDIESLISKNLIDSRNQSIKILANGQLERKLTIRVKTSKEAKEQIEKLGGKVI